MLAARIARHAIVGARAQGVRLLQFTRVAHENDMCSDTGRQLARATDEIDIVGEHQRMNTDRQTLEGVGGYVTHIDFEIRHVQQALEPLTRALTGERQQRSGNRRRAQQNGCSLGGRPPERIVQNRASGQQMLGGPRGRLDGARRTLQPSGNCLTGRSALC